jgi:2-polyprenyl-3-methyl-5-hydroxy-6-metoxy-1,4-benzoquinol methylase
MSIYNYESDKWSGLINRKGLDFPRLKLDVMVKAIKSFNVQNILEAGCGGGKFVFSLSEDFPNARITGVDISKEAIEVAQKKNSNQNLHFLCANAEAMNFPEESFDVILLLDVLEHLEKPEKTVMDCYRFLKPNGIIHAFIPCEAHSVYWLGERILGFHSKEKTAGHIQRFKKTDALNLFGTHMHIVQKRYSFHLLGSIMDYLLFTTLLNKKSSNVFWSENKYYNTGKKKSFAGTIMNLLLSFGSAIAYCESLLLQNVSFTATGIHITAQKVSCK